MTLKSFRKILGYDTFNSILKKDLDEKADPADYYNVTVNIMLKRNPPPRPEGTPLKINGVPLSRAMDKGFPYDDSNI